MRYYNTIAEGYEELHGEEQRKKMVILRSLINEFDISPKKVLDIGCGTGISMEGFKNCIGIDTSFGLLSKAKRDIVQGKGQELPFKEKVFDLVLCVTSFHHMRPFENTISEIKRVGKKWVMFSLLKQGIEEIIPCIKSSFIIEKELEEAHDKVLLCQI